MNRLTEECCICLQMNLAEIIDNEFNGVRIYCCGICICKGCYTQTKERSLITGIEWTCPLCRAPFAKSAKADFRQAMKKAKQGKAWAQEAIGQMYLNGEGVKKNDKKSFKWYSLAAVQGEAASQIHVGEMYSQGKGVKKDDVKAFHFFKLAAEQGSISAMTNLGVCYANGFGTEKSSEDAAIWYQRACDTGVDSLAESNLALCFYLGEGVKLDYNRAFHYFSLSAERGFKNSQFNLGLCYANGQGVETSLTKSLYWFTECMKDNPNELTCKRAKDNLDQLTSLLADSEMPTASK